MQLLRDRGVGGIDDMDLVAGTEMRMDAAVAGGERLVDADIAIRVLVGKHPVDAAQRFALLDPAAVEEPMTTTGRLDTRAKSSWVRNPWRATKANASDAAQQASTVRPRPGRFGASGVHIRASNGNGSAFARRTPAILAATKWPA